MALLEVERRGGVTRHEGEEAAGGVTGGVGYHLERVSHDDSLVWRSGDSYPCQGDIQQNIPPMVIASPQHGQIVKD